MERDVDLVPLRPVIFTRLHELGRHRIDSFHLEDWEMLSRELEVSEEEAKRLIGVISGYSRNEVPSWMQARTAWDLLQEQRLNPRMITTGSEQLDRLLGGGVAPGTIVEFSGAPGIGKTQLCMQLCVNVQLPDALSGIQGSAIYIDTDGAFVVERLREMAEAIVEKCREEADSDDTIYDDTVRGALQQFNVDEVLARIFHFRCHDYFDMLTVVHLLPEFAQKRNVKLIVIDSVASHFRYAFEDDLAKRARIMNSFMQKLNACAIENKIAVVMTNQMTTRVAAGEDTRLIPALGTNWGYSCSVRVNLSWRNDTRIALLFKSPSRGQSTAPFIVSAAGIRDIISMDTLIEPEKDREATLLMSSLLADEGDDSILADDSQPVTQDESA
ncbi:DNA repair protein RAD51-like protein 3 [Hypsibius exemplaris]|uniref:DNA repair protein RAD51 homolog 3 n=1 Tax=Hypsibius exemplaris TaxID=2072580 RepID=A0A1W0WMX3_HYPEX|nr:DNA repair protein RAD51-like protein 3 [Hypsibius exemplaris]